MCRELGNVRLWIKTVSKYRNGKTGGKDWRAEKIKCKKKERKNWVQKLKNGN